MPPLRKQALAIFKAALAAADPIHAVLAHLKLEGNTLSAGRRKYDLTRVENVYVIGAGKAGAAMARAIGRVFGRRITRGLINVKYGHVASLRRIGLNECGHPVPDAAGLLGAERIAEIARAAGSRDLVVCLISGGASALLPSPAPPITLEEMQAATQLLLASGADIHEFNAVRKHISAIKGGQLARMAAPATVIALLLSDVLGDDPGVIGSGPVAPDHSTFADALAVLRKYRLLQGVARSVRKRLEAGARGDIPETPKPGDAAFQRTQNLVVGSNRLAVDAAVAKARQLGLRPYVLSTLVDGDTRDLAYKHAAIARRVRSSGRPVQPPACLISGGETTVTVRGNGLGGRNQEFVLTAAMDLSGLDKIMILSAGTDGTDGPTDAAGAIADGSTITRAQALGLDAARYLLNNDSYHYFEPLGDLIKTGPTNTNVMDIRLICIA